VEAEKRQLVRTWLDLGYLGYLLEHARLSSPLRLLSIQNGRRNFPSNLAKRSGSEILEMDILRYVLHASLVTQLTHLNVSIMQVERVVSVSSHQYRAIGILVTLSVQEKQLPHVR